MPQLLWAPAAALARHPRWPANRLTSSWRCPTRPSTGSLKQSWMWRTRASTGSAGRCLQLESHMLVPHGNQAYVTLSILIRINDSFQAVAPAAPGLRRCACWRPPLQGAQSAPPHGAAHPAPLQRIIEHLLRYLSKNLPQQYIVRYSFEMPAFLHSGKPERI